MFTFLMPRLAFSASTLAAMLLCGVPTCGNEDDDEDEVDEGSADGGTDGGAEDAGLCGDLVTELTNLDGVHTCQADSDCILVGAYAVGPPCEEDPHCMLGAALEFGYTPRGVFVDAADEATATQWLNEATAHACVPHECATDGVTFEGKCLSERCAAVARGCMPAAP